MTIAQPRRVLILGGTQWLGREIARRHVDRGARVVCLARGESGAAPEGARLIVADRDLPGALDAVAEDWDEVVDLTSTPAHAESAVIALGDRAAHWTFVSSVSAQRLDAPEGAAEDDDLVPEDATGEDYGGAKAWIERTLTERLGDRLAIVRPGLIGGPGDPSDRFGYWVARAALAATSKEQLLMLPWREQPAQVIDVRDVADFIAGPAASLLGVVNAVGESCRLMVLIGTAGRLAEFPGRLWFMSDEDLAAHDIGYWAGPRALPLTLPPELENHARRSHARYSALGGRHRPLVDMLADQLDDERRRGIDRTRATGLTREDELAVIWGMLDR